MFSFHLIKCVNKLFSWENVDGDKVSCDAENSEANLCNVGILMKKQPLKTANSSSTILHKTN